MSDIITTKTRPRIKLPGGEELWPRDDLASEIGVSPKTCGRLFPTVYVANVAYHPHDESLQILAGRVRHRNQPSPRRRGRPAV